MKNKKLILIISIIIVLIIIAGSSYAFWIWESDRGNDTNVSFTTQGKNFSCSADGGGNITSNDVLLEPAKCTDTSNAIVREIHTNIVNNANQDIRLDLWLNINSLDTELANSPNFKWAITDSNAGCDKGNILGTGIFKMRTSGDKQIILEKAYSLSSTDTYYLYIWLDEEETDTSTAGKTFNMSLGGECSDSNMPNKPYINNSGLVPVKLSDSGDTVTAISEDNPDWYDYYDKKWANAVLVDSTNRSNYQNLTGNTEVNIPTSEILAYYVWIPRYSYKVWQYSGTSSTGEEREIDIKFVGEGVKEKATQNGEYYTHPAFTFGDKELTGVWMAKFPTSHTTLTTASNGLNCNVTSCTTVSGLRILPNVTMLTNNTITNFFYASRHMEDAENVFGLDPDKIDSHMIKNTEWGVATYLAHSRYGINGKPNVSGTTAKTSLLTDYNTKSTTGNVTGVYDMISTYAQISMSRYGNDDFNSVIDEKYFDRYSSPPFSNTWDNVMNCTLETCGGSALNETYKWYNSSTGYEYFSKINNIYMTRSNYFTYNSGLGDKQTYIASRFILVEE